MDLLMSSKSFFWLTTWPQNPLSEGSVRLSIEALKVKSGVMVIIQFSCLHSSSLSSRMTLSLEGLKKGHSAETRDAMEPKLSSCALRLSLNIFGGSLDLNNGIAPSKN